MAFSDAPVLHGQVGGFRAVRDRTAAPSAAFSGVGLSWVANWAQQRWGIFAMCVGLVTVLVLAIPGGFFSKSGPLGRVVAGLLLIAYVVLSPFLLSSMSFLPALGSVSLLWCAATVLTWRSLREHREFANTALFAALLLAGVAALLAGVAILSLSVGTRSSGSILSGVAFLLFGVAILSFGAENLRGVHQGAGAATFSYRQMLAWAKRKDDDTETGHGHHEDDGASTQTK